MKSFRQLIAVAALAAAAAFDHCIEIVSFPFRSTIDSFRSEVAGLSRFLREAMKTFYAFVVGGAAKFLSKHFGPGGMFALAQRLYQNFVNVMNRMFHSHGTGILKYGGDGVGGSGFRHCPST